MFLMFDEWVMVGLGWMGFEYDVVVFLLMLGIVFCDDEIEVVYLYE